MMAYGYSTADLLRLLFVTGRHRRLFHYNNIPVVLCRIYHSASPRLMADACNNNNNNNINNICDNRRGNFPRCWIWPGYARRRRNGDDHDAIQPEMHRRRTILAKSLLHYTPAGRYNGYTYIQALAVQK